MEVPLISILLPTYNRVGHLPERMASIEAQTLGDFEVVVCDSFSNDGSKEVLEAWAARDGRVRVFYVPKEGIYAGWNECLRRARGKYIYWATSDDGMLPETLEKLHGALVKNPGCRVAMCGLSVVDGEEVPVTGESQWEESPWGKFWGKKGDLGRECVRRAPVDLVLGGVLHNPWLSTNQLLLERSVYEEAGEYRRDLGPGADFEWNLRAASFVDVAFVPEKLVTLCMHEGSATKVNLTRCVADMDVKIRVLGLVEEWLAGKGRGELVKRLRKAGWAEAFLLQGEIYRWRERGVLAGMPGFVRFLLGGGVRRWGFFFGFLVRVPFGKDCVRSGWARRVTKGFGGGAF